MSVVTLVVVCWCVVPSCAYAQIDDPRARLLARVLARDTSLIPPNDDHEPLRISLAMSLKSIDHVEEKTRMVTVSFWLCQNWTDTLVQWKRSRINISSLDILREYIWTPNTVLQNGVNIQEFISRDVTIYETGEVRDVRILQAKLQCLQGKHSGASNSTRSNEDNETNDLHGKSVLTCSLALGTWSNDRQNLVYEPGVATIGNEHRDESGEWIAYSIQSYSTNQVSIPVEQTSVVIFHLTLAKRAHTKNVPSALAVPSSLTSLVATGAFLFPRLRRDRITLVGVAFVGQILLAGFSMLAQTGDPLEAHSFILFSVVFIFIVFVAAVVSFFLIQRIDRAGQSGRGREQLFTLQGRMTTSATAEAILCVCFLVLLCIGTAITLS